MRAANESNGRRSGQAAVEFALAALLILGMIFGMIDLGRLIFMRTMFTNAVREAARQASITPGNMSAIEAAAQQRSPSLTLGTGSFALTCSKWKTNASVNCASSDVDQLDLVRVCSTYTFTVVATRIVGRSSITATECMYASVH